MRRTVAGLPLAEPFTTARVKARERRNGFSIAGYTGTNGGGKTLAAVYDSLPALAAGRPVVSTCRILDPATGEPHPLWVPLDDFRVLLEISFCDVILDEVTGVASSRDSMGLPSSVLNHLMQLRKRDVTLRWTTPNWRRADTAIREVTQSLTTCQGFARSEHVVTDEDTGLIRRWHQRRGFLWRTYDAKNFEEWSAAKERSSAKNHRIRPVARQVLWGPGAIARECYDTYEHALSVGAVSEAGLCMDCGHKRRAKPCTCDPDAPHDHEPSAGMRAWRRLDSARRAASTSIADAEARDELAAIAAGVRLGGRHAADVSAVLIPETDDTPAVVVETSAPA